MLKIEMTIVMVHTYEFRIARQTLRNIRRIAPSLSLEIVIVDNNPLAGFGTMLRAEFPEVRYFPMEKNMGFGSAMNVGIREARGEFVFIFNPDLAPEAGSLDLLLHKLQSDATIGILAPQLQNPDGSLQYSIFTDPTLLIPAFRRTFLGKLAWGKEKLDAFQLRDRDHTVSQDVDWAMGSSLLARKEDLFALGGFDEQFFMYYEDADLCRRMREMGKRVVYFPAARMVHYHRRASADGSLFQQLLNPLAWQHIRSAFLYAKKYRHGTSSASSLQKGMVA
jgi:N-acetylglucosaminyl-diphospho-decaprenol L-rhamnosyltransferase